MAYSVEISRANPTAFLFLIDQSGSMADAISWWRKREQHGGKRMSMADAINRFLQELAIKCEGEEGVRDYFHVGVIGYGGRRRARVWQVS